MPVDEDHGITYDIQLLVRDTDWTRLTKQLLLYSAARIFHFGGVAATLRSRTEDYVQEAVKLILDGTRHFDPSERTLFGALSGVIDSLISHDLEKSVRRGVHLSLVQADGDNLIAGEMLEEHLAAKDDFEAEIVLRDQFEAFLASLHDDAELQRYARLRAANTCVTADEYAALMRMPVENVRNMDRRLRRRRLNWSTRQ